MNILNLLDQSIGLPFGQILSIMILSSLIAFALVSILASDDYLGFIRRRIDEALPDGLLVKKALYDCAACHSGHWFLAMLSLASPVLGFEFTIAYLAIFLVSIVFSFVIGVRILNYFFAFAIFTWFVAIAVFVLPLTAFALLVLAALQILLSEVIHSLLARVII